jgi:hypothetical protein
MGRDGRSWNVSRHRSGLVALSHWLPTNQSSTQRSAKISARLAALIADRMIVLTADIQTTGTQPSAQPVLTSDSACNKVHNRLQVGPPLELWQTSQCQNHVIKASHHVI